MSVASSTPSGSVKGFRLGASETIRPTFRSWFGQPSSRLPIPGATESSTVEWQKAQVMPIELSVPPLLKMPLTPRTEFNFRSASVVAGPSRSTLPPGAPRPASVGSASTSTFRPTASAVFGLTPAPTPPSLAPSIALCSWSLPPQKSSSPKVSKRKMSRPSSNSFSRAFASKSCDLSFAGESSDGLRLCDHTQKTNAPTAADTAIIRPIRLGRSILNLLNLGNSGARHTCKHVTCQPGNYVRGNPGLLRGGLASNPGR